MGQYKSSETLKSFIKQAEGYSNKAYKDSAGILTIGYGHTKGVVRGMTITRDVAERFLDQDLLGCERYVNAIGVCKTQGQFDALVDFCYNLGAGNLNRSTLLRMIRHGSSEAAIRNEFSKWVHAGGKILPGLVRRRQWEADRFFN